jgi:hypothetical protein
MVASVVSVNSTSLLQLVNVRADIKNKRAAVVLIERFIVKKLCFKILVSSLVLQLFKKGWVFSKKNFKT